MLYRIVVAPGDVSSISRVRYTTDSLLITWELPVGGYTDFDVMLDGDHDLTYCDSPDACNITGLSEHTPYLVSVSTLVSYDSYKAASDYVREEMWTGVLYACSATHN